MKSVITQTEPKDNGKRKKKGITPFVDMVRKWAQRKIQAILPKDYILEANKDFSDGFGEGYEDEFERAEDE